MITVSQPSPLAMADYYLLVIVKTYRIHSNLANWQINAGLVMVIVLLLPQPATVAQPGVKPMSFVEVKMEVHAHIPKTVLRVNTALLICRIVPAWPTEQHMLRILLLPLIYEVRQPQILWLELPIPMPMR